MRGIAFIYYVYLTAVRMRAVARKEGSILWRFTMGTSKEGLKFKARIETILSVVGEWGVDGGDMCHGAELCVEPISCVQIEQSTVTKDYFELVVSTEHGEANSISSNINKHLRKAMAHALTDIILNDYEPKIILKLIMKQRPEYRGEVANELLDRCQKRIISDRLPVFLDRNHIIDHVVDYLAESNTLNVSGFVRFRLRDYMNGLEDAVTQLIDDYEVELEREEFIALLRDYVDHTAIGMQTAHVLPDGGDRLVIVNQQGELFDEQFDEPYGEGLQWSEGEDTWGIKDAQNTESLWEPEDDRNGMYSWSDREEWLISSLVAIAPSRVVLHFAHHDHLNMMEDVFGGKLVFCGGCSRCMHLRERSTH